MTEKRSEHGALGYCFFNNDSVFRVSNQNPYMEAANDSAQGHTCSDTAKVLTMMAGALRERPFGEIKSHVPPPPKQAH